MTLPHLVAEIAYQDSEQEPDELRSRPTVDGWEREIQRTLHGERNYHVERLGAARGYLRVLIRDSIDPTLATEACLRALNSIVGTWQPLNYNRADYTARLLDIIEGFHPEAAFHKLVEGLINPGTFPQATDPDETEGRVRNLEKKAFYILSQYLPTVPGSAGQYRSFDTYVRLFGDLVYTQYADYIKDLLERSGQSPKELDDFDKGQRTGGTMVVEAIATIHEMPANERTKAAINYAQTFDSYTDEAAMVKKLDDSSGMETMNPEQVVKLLGGLPATYEHSALMGSDISVDLTGICFAEGLRFSMPSADLTASELTVKKHWDKCSREWDQESEYGKLVARN
jgi:hypothetical protein